MKSLSVKGIFVLLLLAFVAPIRGRGQTVTCTVHDPCPPDIMRRLDRCDGELTALKKL